MNERTRTSTSYSERVITTILFFFLQVITATLQKFVPSEKFQWFLKVWELRYTVQQTLAVRGG